jgi:hypothetical protein
VEKACLCDNFLLDQSLETNPDQKVEEEGEKGKPKIFAYS